MKHLPRPVVLGALVLAQLLLVAVAVAPQLSARVTGETYLLAVQPFDPIDPFRGAYVTLGYPGIQDRDWSNSGSEDTEWVEAPRGDVYAALVPDGDLHAVGAWSTTRPEQGPYLACRNDGWEFRCGIESFFVSQSRAQALEAELARGNGVAEIKVDARGNAAIVDITSRSR